MSTTFLSSREISAAPGKVLRRLRRGSTTVVTANGKPVAILAATSGATLERDLSVFSRARFAQALAALQAAAANSGASRLSAGAVDTEIAAARKERRRRHVA
jgi:antitoxin (DNA-binding transcriptional repressor) of toxin-antitoxin stability system